MSSAEISKVVKKLKAIMESDFDDEAPVDAPMPRRTGESHRLDYMKNPELVALMKKYGVI